MTGNTCAQCGKSLYGQRADSLYCSPACRQQAYRQRNRPSRNTGPVTATPAGSVPAATDLDAEIAALQESIRAALWHTARASWQVHQKEPFTFDGEDPDEEAVAAAMICAWQKALDRGHAQPGGDIPDAPWPGLGLDEDSLPEPVVWTWVDAFCRGAVAASRRLEHRWVARDLYRQAAAKTGELIALLFDADGDFIEEADQEHRWRYELPDHHSTLGDVPNAPRLAVHSPRRLFGDLIGKVDHAAIIEVRDLLEPDEDDD